MSLLLFKTRVIRAVMLPTAKGGEISTAESVKEIRARRRIELQLQQATF